MKMSKEEAEKAADSKGQEIFYKTTLRFDFQKDVQICRDKFGIPISGFKTLSERKEWFGKLGNKYDPFIDHYLSIQNKYKLSNSVHNLLEEYIMSNNQFPMWPSLGRLFFAEVVDDKEEKYYKKIKKPYVKLLIFEHASQRNVSDYLRDCWGYIQNQLTQKAGYLDNKRVRISQNKNRDFKIYELSRLQKSELLKIANERLVKGYGGYKESIIARIIEKDFGEQISSENIKIIISRQRKVRIGNS